MLPKVGTTIGQKYALEAVIGQGGMGAVYRAKNLLTGRRVALKWILPTLNGADEMRARLFREARAMGRIEHPNVCAVYDVGQDGDAIYLVMELLSGRTLRALMEEKRLPLTEIASILLEGMQGVSAAHAAGVVHRDLKPDNLFVCFDEDGRRGTTKVLDFGVSKILDLAESDGLTKSGMAVGTPHYMSPEQIIGSKEVDARSDVYGLGAILYQALAGRLPFEADNYSALVVQIATCSPDPLEKHTDEERSKLAPLVHRALARNPSERFVDVAEMALALEPFAGGAVRFETPKPRPRSVPPPPSDETSLGPASERPTATSAASGQSAAATLPAHASGAEALLPSVPPTPTPAPVTSPAERTLGAPTPQHPERALWIGGGIALVIALVIGVRAFGIEREPREPSEPTTETPSEHAPTHPETASTAVAPREVAADLHPGSIARAASAPIEPPTTTPAPTTPTTVVRAPESPSEETPAAAVDPEPIELAAEVDPALATADARPVARTRLTSQAQTRTRVRVIDVVRGTAGAAPARAEEAPTTSETTVMTATGRSGTLSTSDFE